MDPEGSIPNSQELSTCSYPEPDQSSPHHPIPPLQIPPNMELLSLYLHKYKKNGGGKKI
jgi:hypothetical protein